MLELLEAIFCYKDLFFLFHAEENFAGARRLIGRGLIFCETCFVFAQVPSMAQLTCGKTLWGGKGFVL